MELDWFPETVVRKAEDEPTRKGSKYETIRLSVTSTPLVTESSGVATVRLTSREPGKPYYLEDGTLVIPTDALPRYQWWNGGITLEAIIAETAGLACPVDYTKVSEFTDQ